MPVLITIWPIVILVALDTCTEFIRYLVIVAGWSTNVQSFNALLLLLCNRAEFVQGVAVCQFIGQILCIAITTVLKSSARQLQGRH